MPNFLALPCLLLFFLGHCMALSPGFYYGRLNLESELLKLVHESEAPGDSKRFGIFN